MFGFGKFDGKCEEKNIEMKSKRKKKQRKIKDALKINKLFLYISLNSFYFFLFIIAKLKNLN